MVSEHMHHSLVVKENPVWVKASGFIVHVVGYLGEARAWSSLGVVVVLFFRVGVVFCFSVDFSDSWSTCMLDIPVAMWLTPCMMLSESLPFSLKLSCSSSLKWHDQM